MAPVAIPNIVICSAVLKPKCQASLTNAVLSCMKIASYAVAVASLHPNFLITGIALTNKNLTAVKLGTRTIIRQMINEHE